MKNFGIEKKHIIDSIRKKYQDVRFYYTFDNLYVWQESWQIDLFLEDDMYAASIGDKADNRWFFPLGNDDCKLRFLEKQMKNERFSLYCMSEADKIFLENKFAGKFLVERDRDRDEYVYRIADHLAETGRKNNNFRRRWRHFLEYGPYCFQPLEAGNVQDATSVLHQWYEKHDCTPSDYIAMTTLEKCVFFENPPEDFDRGIIYAGDQPVAVVAGYPVTADVYDFCILKDIGSNKYMNYGIMRYMMEMLCNRYDFINMEDDLGIPGLREMKQTRLPDRMNEMWKAELLRQAAIS